MVTGSRIPQTGLYSSSPVTAVGQQEMKFEGTTNVEDLINNLPQAFASFGTMEANGATGTATVDLRDLGPKRTLVLIDGKRLMPGDPSEPVADLNQIPAALVDHVEVLTGGASATYGSDAVAGVVNFIMRKDFEGVEVDGQYSVAQHNNGNGIAEGAINAAAFPIVKPNSSYLDGAYSDINILLGVNSDNGKGNLTMYAGYKNTQAVLESSRDFSDCAMNSAPLLTGGKGFFCSGSSNAAVGNIRSEDSFIDPVTGMQLNPHLGAPFRGLPGGNDVEPYLTSRDAFNFAPLNYLQRPDERYTMGAMGHYEVNKALDIYTSLMFMDDHTVAQIAPSGWFRGGGSFGGNMHMNCDNPYMGSAGDPNSAYNIFCAPLINQGLITPTSDVNLQIGRRLVEAGNRQDNLRHTSYREVFGAKGDLGGGWSYDAFGQYGTTILAEEYLNDASNRKLQNSLEAVTDPTTGLPVCKAALDGSDPACVPFSLFNLSGVTPAMINYVRGNGFQEGSTQEWVMGGTVTGDLGEWGIQSPWAKNPVAVAFGTEYRQEHLDLRTDDAFTTGDLAGQGGPRPSVHGGFNVREAYTEVRVPLVQNMPWVEDLTLSGAYRYSSYSNAGAVDAYKYGAEWQPIDDFRIRASYQRAVRAPNVLELFFPQSIGLWGGADPCGTHPGFTQAQCDHTNHDQHLANYGNGTLDCPAGQCSALFGGNQNLKPETSDTRTVGLVFTPTFFDGFTATIDYFNIKVAKLITNLPQADIIQGCALTDAPFFCNLINRAPVSGILYGNAGFVTTLDTNTGYLKTQGVDIESNYTTDLSNWGMGDNGGLSFNLVGTYTSKYEQEPVPDFILKAANIVNPITGAPVKPSYGCAGEFGNVCGTPIPRWRHKLRVTWNSPWDFDFTVQWRHMSGVKLDINENNHNINGLCGGPCGDTADASIPTYDYLDLAADWTVRPGVQIHAGVNNVLDRDPPILDSSYVAVPPFGNGNTYPQVYDALGRVLFVGATIKY
ncbi:MAG TPA: TonB-dependent receptor [Rhizomicrobium sp.]